MLLEPAYVGEGVGAEFGAGAEVGAGVDAEGRCWSWCRRMGLRWVPVLMPGAGAGGAGVVGAGVGSRGAVLELVPVLEPMSEGGAEMGAGVDAGCRCWRSRCSWCWCWKPGGGVGAGAGVGADVGGRG